MNIVIKAIGKRKTSIANILLKKGTGNILITNKKSNEKKRFDEYFYPKAYLKNDLYKPLIISNLEEKFDIIASIAGGGIMSQLYALKLALAKGICKYNLQYRKKLKQYKLLTRDSRIKERRKYGLKKARKASQYHKR